MLAIPLRDDVEVFLRCVRGQYAEQRSRSHSKKHQVERAVAMMRDQRDVLPLLAVHVIRACEIPNVDEIRFEQLMQCLAPISPNTAGANGHFFSAAKQWGRKPIPA